MFRSVAKGDNPISKEPGVEERTWRWVRWTATAMAVVFVYSNVLAPPLLQAGFWEERRQAVQTQRHIANSRLAGSSHDPTNPRTPFPFDRSPLLLAQLTPLIPGSATDLPRTVPPPFLASAPPQNLPRVARRQLSAVPWLQHLPWEWVTVQAIDWPVQAKATTPIVIHLQDVHGHPEAQLHIGRALLQLLAAPPSARLATPDLHNAPSPLVGEGGGEGVRPLPTSPLLVGVEGASGPFVLDPFRAVPQATIRQHVSEALIREGLLSGPEYAGMTAPVAPILWGVEDEPLYLAHLQAFKQALPLQAKTTERLHSVSREVNQLKRSVYPPALQELDAQLTAYRTGTLEVGSYLRFLMTFAHRIGINAPDSQPPVGSPRSPPAHQARSTSPRAHGARAYPALTTWLAAEALERTLNLSQADRERHTLLRQLADRLTPQALQGLISPPP
ncbi:MAG: hypothetical protein HYZ73_06225 [Elusimicrobia bacterium]|nr:hypothetical protein [Elusimicrobiota bacterium]